MYRIRAKFQTGCFLKIFPGLQVCFDLKFQGGIKSYKNCITVCFDADLSMQFSNLKTL